MVERMRGLGYELSPDGNEWVMIPLPERPSLRVMQPPLPAQLPPPPIEAGIVDVAPEPVQPPFARARRVVRAVVSAVSPLRLSLTAKGVASCPYCRDTVNESKEAWVSCGGCETLLHAECWDDLGRCPTLGCPKVEPLCNESPALTPPFEAESELADGLREGPRVSDMSRSAGMTAEQKAALAVAVAVFLLAAFLLSWLGLI
ncbi:MAG TPA: hypothetical protein VFH61_09365 [Thermoleophilia bacterium]|nr:hypothetical protein [Thermoleophilia bacterium]